MKIIKPLENITAKEKQPATFTFEVDKPNLPVTWYVNNTKVEPGVKYNVTSEGQVHKLVIENVKPEDASDVRVECKELTSTAKLIVEGGQSLNFLLIPCECLWLNSHCNN